MTLNSRSYKAVPEVVAGYGLNKLQFSIILPIERTNLITNPSFETNTTGYTLVDGATLTRTTETQRRGVFSLRIKPGASSVSGVFYTSSALVAGQTYAFSLDVNIRGGRKFQIRAFDGVRSLVTKPVTGKGYWERIAFVFTAVTSGAHRFYFEKNGDSNNATTDNVFTDGWQLELCESGNYWETTYIDGDQLGLLPVQTPSAYRWAGTPHASQSIRRGQTRAGGQVVKLSDLGFRLMAVVGLGMTSFSNVSTPFGLIGGSIFQRTIPETKNFTLVGEISGATYSEFSQNRTAIENIVSPDVVAVTQPLVVVMDTIDSCGDNDGETLEVVCSYAGGLDGNINNYHQERVSISFTQFDPSQLQVAGNTGVQIPYIQSVSDVDYLVRLKYDGTLERMGTFNNRILSANIGSDGMLYVAGVFFTIDGITYTLCARWNGTNWEGFAGGATGGSTQGRYLYLALDGFIYAAGSFAAIGGVAAANVARWNGTAWSAMGSGYASGIVQTIVSGNDGYTYFGGTFPAMGGVANTNGIARWNGTVWSAVGTGISVGQVWAIVKGLDGTIYAVGTFTSMGGVANTNFIAKWNGTAWSSVGGGVGAGSSITSAFIAPDGSLYVGGAFTAIGGVAALNVARWNGTAWSPLSTGITGGSSPVDQIDGGLNNTVFIFGDDLATAGPLVNTVGRITVWNGSNFMYFPLNSNVSIYNSTDKALPDNFGNIYRIYSDQNLVATSPGLATAVNSGDVRTYPTVTIYGPGRLYQIANITTSKVIQFDDLLLVSGEILTLVLKPGFISVTSNYRGNMLGVVIPSSNISDFFLQPGNNTVSVYIEAAGGPTAAYMTWRNSKLGITSGVRR